jgi:hydroxyacylglutathione hydrolase
MEIKRFTLGDIKSNCYIVVKNQHALVIDPGYDSMAVKQFLKDNDLEVDIIYATHGHFDHIGGINALKALYPKAEVIAPKLDAVFFDPALGISRLGYKVHVDSWLDSDIEQELSFQDLVFKVIHTPGHSQGGTSLYLACEGVLFSGDTLFYMTVGRTDLYLSSFEDLKDSLQNKLYLLPDNTICYPGHGRTTHIGFEKKFNSVVRMA